MPPSSSSSNEKIENKYHLEEKIKHGGFGIVYSGVRINDKSPVAIKTIQKQRIVYWEDKLPLEISFLKKLKQVQGVIKLLDYFEFKNVFAIVMERPEFSIDLFDYIQQNGS